MSEFERLRANRWMGENERVQRSYGECEQVLESVSEFKRVQAQQEVARGSTTIIIHLTDLPPKFHNGLKSAKYWAIWAVFIDRKTLTATIPKQCNFSKPQHKLVLRWWFGCHFLKLGEEWPPISEIRPGVCAPQNMRNRKMGDSEINNFKTAEDDAFIRGILAPIPTAKICTALRNIF